MNIIYNPALLDPVQFSTLDVGECCISSGHLMMKISTGSVSNVFNFDSHDVTTVSELSAVFKVQVDAFVRYV